MKNGFLLFTILLCSFLSFGQKLPYQNPLLSSEERANDLMNRLTIPEKAILMCDVSEAIPRLGIKKFNWWSEALHGYANQGNVTVFPEPIAMAASFDNNMVFHVFDFVSDEARAKYNETIRKGTEDKRFNSLSVWTPNINIFRDPRWGRGQETYGEDPFLTATMGVSVVNGLQGPVDSKYKKLLACAKHFAVHSGPESTRHTADINDVKLRDLYETYLPAFKTLVMDADVREVMCAYQRLDNDPCCGSTQLLQRILREDWGFKYLVVSDCGAITDFVRNSKVSSDNTHAATKAVLAGTDVECAGYAYKQIPDAVAKGLLKESDINKSVLRLLRGRFDLGEMDDNNIVPWSKIPMSVVNSDEHKKLALDMARETMTLLQNKNNALPLSKTIKIAVLGPNADDKRVLWGNYNGTPNQTSTILDGIKTKLPAAKIFYDKACEVVDDKIVSPLISSCSIGGKTGIKATYWNNRDLKGDVVTVDQIVSPIQLTTLGAHQFGQGVNMTEFSGKYETVFKPAESGEIVFKYEARGKFELKVDGKVISNPAGRSRGAVRIPFTVEQGKEYQIEATFVQTASQDASLNFTMGKEIPVNFDALIEKLKGYDVVVFAGGINSQLEGEEMPVTLPGFSRGDRTDMELPLPQRNCLEALKKAGKKVIFVNCSGSAMGFVPETSSCDAILQAWYPGEAGGQAVADVLFGDYNPQGKLPLTFYKNIQQLPAFEDYNMKGRTYRYMTADPLFPFGFGLSYTTFSVGEAKINKSQIQTNEGVELSVPVSNLGKRNGIEVVQVYLHKLNDPDGPLKTLRAFKRVEVAAGKNAIATISIPSKSLEWFDTSTNTVRVHAGDYEILYGTSSDNKDLKTLKITIL
jgi:beta-glucosidase